MATTTPLKSLIRLALFAVLLSGVLLGLISAPAYASPGFAVPPRQEEPSPDEGPDLTGVVLRLEDMPPGFEELQENQKEAMTTALAQMGRALGSGSRIRTQNATGYWNADPANIQMIVSLLISPLNEVEQKNFDNTIQKPDQLLTLMPRMLGANTQAELLEGNEDIGETSFAFSVLASSGGLEIRMDIIAARRGEVVEQILVAYLDGQQPATNVHDIARILDDRLAQVVPPPVAASEGFRPTDVLVPELTTHIPTPLDLSTDPAVIGANLLLAAIVMILLTIAIELANSTLEENEPLLQHLLRPLHAFSRLFGRVGAATGRLGKLAIFSLLALAVLILLYGLTFSLLEPGWNLLSTTGVWLFLCLTVGGGIVGLADEVIQWASARRWGVPTAIRLRPANLLIAFASTGFSRLFGVIPGFMFGSPQAIDIDAASLEKRRQARLVWIGVTTALLVGLGLWLLTILTNLLQRGDLPNALSVAIGGLESLFLSIFALAVQNGFVQMLPLPNTYGRLLQRRSRWFWVLLLLAITFLFYHTLINPKGNLGSAWSSVNVQVFVITAAVGMILSLLVWLGFRLVNRGRSKKLSTVEGDTLEASEMDLTPAETLAPEASPVEIIQPAAEGTVTPAPPTQPVAPEITLPEPPGLPTELETPLPEPPGQPFAPETILPAQASQPAEMEIALPEPPLPPDEEEIPLPADSLGLSGETKLCPRCGETIMAEARFCPLCATPIEDTQPAPSKEPEMNPPTTQTCPQCSQPIPLEAQFCPFCGARVGAQAIPQARSEIPTQPGLPAAPTRLPAQPAYVYQPPKRRNDWPIIILGGSMLVLLCCLTVVAIGWWQRERIPLLTSLLGQPTATSTPRPTRTPRPTNTPRPTPRPVVTEVVVITAVPEKGPVSKLCLLPAGPLNDSSFNALAWSGVQSAAAQYGAESIYLETRGYTDAEFRSALDQLIPQDCDLIVGVGFSTAEAIRQKAISYPQQKFLLLDASIAPPLPNVWSQNYASDQGAFMAGYLAAAVSRTGKVSTFGGMDLPVVRTYMNGFAAGASYYNQMHNTTVQVLGWDIINQTGLFSNDFTNAQQGQILAKQLFNQGADILFPVAGLTGYGAAAEATTRSRVYIIGVDNDWALERPEYSAVMLTSVEKRLDTSIFLATAAIGTHTFQGGEHIGTLATEVNLAPFHNLDWLVSDAVRAELDQVKADIIAGKINTQVASGPVSGLVKSGELTIWVPDSFPEHINRWVTKYQLANPEVKVTIEAVSSADIVDRWKVSVAAGTGPDLILNGSANLFPEWARSGLMLPLDDLLEGKIDGFSGTAIANLIVDGRLYGVPYISYSQAMYYNKKLLPNPPETMDELANLVRQGKKITLLRVTYFLFPFFSAFGGELVDSNGRCIADQNGGFVDALKYLQTLTEDGAVLATDYAAFADPFRDGQVAMTINGPWILSDYQEALGDNLGVALIPRGRSAAAPILGLSAFLVNPSSRNPQLAVDLALFLASPEAQADLEVYSIPVRTDIAFEAGDPMAVFVQAAGNGYPEILLTSNFYGPFEAMVTAVLGNGSDPANALRDACQEMNRLNGK